MLTGESHVSIRQVCAWPLVGSGSESTGHGYRPDLFPDWTTILSHNISARRLNARIYRAMESTSTAPGHRSAGLWKNRFAQMIETYRPASRCTSYTSPAGTAPRAALRFTGIPASASDSDASRSIRSSEAWSRLFTAGAAPTFAPK